MGFSRRDLLKMLGAGAITATTGGCVLHATHGASETEPECSGSCQPNDLELKKIASRFGDGNISYTEPATSKPLQGGGCLEMKDSTITFTNKEGETLELAIGEGHLTYSEERQYEYFLERGTLDKIVAGDQEPMDISLDITYEYIRCEPAPEGHYLDIIRAARPNELDVAVRQGDHEVTFSGFMWESMEYDFDAATIYITGRSDPSV